MTNLLFVRITRAMLKVAAVGLGFIFIAPISAQEDSKGINALMDEVVVTARKREENVQDTPIAVSAFTGASLDARGIQKIDDIAQITPNMSFDNFNSNGGGGSSAAIFIRGVGQRDFIPSADPGVGLYVDGVYFARSVGSVLDLIDVERVEVLRGPQGTLFGRNTTGGAVAIHTVKPHEEFDAKIRVKVGTDDKLDILGKVNLPISDNLFMNASLASFNQTGFVVNPLNGMDTGDDETVAFRGAVRWLVYGAYGYTGKLVAQEAVRRGHSPVLAGRNAARVEALAQELQLRSRAFSLDAIDLKDIDFKTSRSYNVSALAVAAILAAFYIAWW